MRKTASALVILLLGAFPTSGPAQSPGEPNEGSRLRLNPDGTRSFAWWGRSGRTYFLKTSEDLVHWSYLPMIQSGAGQAISWGLTTTAPKSFFKLQYTDQPTSNPQTADFDGDHIGNADELRIGTDPFVADLTDGGGTDPGNGIPDAWERAYGLSTSADGNADSDGDGISDYDEYLLGLNPSSAYTNGGGPGGAGGTSDGDLDSDGDGKKNNEDQYPADERRTEDIAGLNYAILDVSKNVMPADKDVDQIAMGQDGRVAFSWWDGNETYKVAKWKDGQLEPGSPKFTATKLYFDWGPGNTAVVALKKDDEAQRLINANGEVAAIGYVSGNASTGADWVLALWPYGTEQVDERNTAASIDEVPERYSMQSGRVLLDSGLLIGESDYDMNPAYTPKTGIGQATSTGSYMAMNLTLEDVIPNIPSGQEPQGSLTCSAVSQSGKIAVSLNVYASSQGPSFQEVGIGESGSYQKIAGAVDDILGFIPVINDSKDFILADSSEGKFLYYKAAAKVDKLENLLPEKYRKQIRFEKPAPTGQSVPTSVSKMISLANSGKLVFTMECLEGRGRGEWVAHTFVSDKGASQAVTSNLRTLQQVRFSENYRVTFKGGPQGLTDNGLLAAIIIQIKDDLGNPIPEAQWKKHPGLAIPYEFTELTPSSGFDGESDPHWLMIPKDGENYTKAYTPATPAFSVKFKMLPGPSGGTVTPESTNMSPEILTVSSSVVGEDRGVKIGAGTSFSSDGLNVSVKNYQTKTLALHAVIQQDGGGAPHALCIGPGPNGVIDTTSLGGDDTIGGGGVKTGADGLCDTIKQGDDVQILRPAIRPQNVPSAAELKDYLKKVFGIQANTCFTVTRSEKVVDYDKNRNGSLNLNASFQTLSDEEAVLDEQVRDASSDFNVFCVKSLTASIVALGKARPDNDCAYVKDHSQILNTIAHETGHLFGLAHAETSGFQGQPPNPTYLPGRDHKKRLMSKDALDPPPTLLVKPEWDIINEDEP